jgi:hypothetical protein
MYNYKLFQSDPDGIQWTMDIQHNVLFSKADFNIIMEECIIEAFDEEKKSPNSWLLKSHINDKFLSDALKKRGFVSDPIYNASYEYNPFDLNSCGILLQSKLIEIDKLYMDRRKKRRTERSL